MEIHSRRTVISAVFALWFLAGMPAFAQEIHGHITLSPPLPEVKPVAVHKKVKDSCADVQMPQGLIVSAAGDLQNAVVWLEGDFKKEYPASVSRIPIFDQKACRFHPHALIVPSGKDFQVWNSDPVTHDIRGFDGPKMLFRFEMGP